MLVGGVPAGELALDEVPSGAASASQAPQLLGGAIVAEAAMDILGVDSVEICPWAMREGVILRLLDHLGD